MTKRDSLIESKKKSTIYYELEATQNYSYFFLSFFVITFDQL